VKGLPLSTVAVEGRSIRLVLKGSEQSSTFEAVLSADGKSMAGNASQGAFSAPFTLTRTGEARIAPAPKSAPIGKELEGTWNGTLDVGGRPMRIVVTMTNHADGTATGTIMSPDGSGVEIPIAMTQTANDVTIEAPSVSLSYKAVLSAAKTELAGTWTQGSSVLPLTLTRAKP
jgi:hypothetical protein